MIRFKQFLQERQITLYHGSRNNHGRFVIGHEGSNSTVFGGYKSTRYGVFFSNNHKFAAIYGDVDKYALHPKKLGNLDDGRLIDQFHEYVRKNGGWLGNWNRPTWEYFEDDIGEEFHKWLTAQKYDVVSFSEFHEDEKGKEIKSKTYVLLDLHRIRRNPDPKQPDLFLR